MTSHSQEPPMDGVAARACSPYPLADLHAAEAGAAGDAARKG